MTVVAVSFMLSPLAATTGSGAAVSERTVPGALPQSADSGSYPTPQGSTGTAVRSETCRSARPALRRTIAERRAATYGWQTRLGYPHTRTAHRERTAIGCRYLRFLRRLWTERADSAYRVWVSLRDPREAIAHVFGIYASEALAVAECESGLSVNAQNGQYLGLLQMGEYARSRYGHGSTALEQARAAYHYFVASGRDWSPWSCRPR